jgi:hypothetical protein
MGVDIRKVENIAKKRPSLFGVLGIDDGVGSRDHDSTMPPAAPGREAAGAPGSGTWRIAARADLLPAPGIESFDTPQATAGNGGVGR